MRGFQSFMVAAGLLLTWTEALSLQRRSPRVLGLPIQRWTVETPLARGRLWRRGTVQESLHNSVRLFSHPR